LLSHITPNTNTAYQFINYLKTQTTQTEAPLEAPAKIPETPRRPVTDHTYLYINKQRVIIKTKYNQCQALWQTLMMKFLPERMHIFISP
jgi:spermidine/putrescine-binding protein